MNDASRKGMKGFAFALSVIVYIACLIYAGVRSYSLFVSTIDQSLLFFALLGIVALELTGLAMPLTIHYWASPGPQRMAAYGFYALDLSAIIFNAILDAAHHSGGVLPEFMTAYSTYAVPALPVLCMLGWALLWILDPVSRQHDMEASVKAATHESLLLQIQSAVSSVDLTEAVSHAAEEAAQVMVRETLGQAPKRKALPTPTSGPIDRPAMPPATAYQMNATDELPPSMSHSARQAALDIGSRVGDDLPTGQYPAEPRLTGRRNGTGAATGPKA